MKIVYFKFNIISKEYLEKIIPINDFLLKETQRVFSLKKYSTDEIIEKSTQIQKHILSLSRIRKYSFWFDTNQKDLVGNYIKETSISMLNILRALQKKLGEQVEKEKNILQRQQLEVKENITGNNYLNQVSELQSNRLKRQIEQFEKLQRILH
ncbi:MAG: hypothetical protein U0518_00435 [Candidatus Gracilibacteria bacterium]